MTAAAFVDAFAAGWSRGREGILGDFMAYVDEDVVLRQPLMPDVRGHAGFQTFFKRVFAAVPDLSGEVLSWRPTAGGVEIELALRGTLGGRPLEMVTDDRIVLRDGRLLERQASFDARPVVRVLLASWLDRLGGEGPLAALAAGRLALGALGRIAPRAATHAFGGGRAASGELDYMGRVFGIRAIALGAGYLSSTGDVRRRWQRLAFMCDVSDTIAGLGHLRRRDLPPRSALALTALTGTYALVGAARIARDRR